jgi:hypothetical protein
LVVVDQAYIQEVQKVQPTEELELLTVVVVEVVVFTAALTFRDQADRELL